MAGKITREEALKTLLASDQNETQDERLDRIERMIIYIASSIVLMQKDAAAVSGLSEDTIRNMALRGEFDPLQADGSRLNFITIKQVSDLKPRRKRARKSK